MQKYFLGGFWLLLLILLAAVAHADPVCNPNYPNTLACLAQSSNLLATDIVGGIQEIGPSRSNQSVKIPIGQILNVPGSTQYLALSGGTLTGKQTTVASSTGGAGFALPSGVAPTSPVNGDLWTTTAGVFAFINGATIGPLGAGGGANTSTLNAIGYYATAGNTLSGLTTANSSVLITSSSGVPSFATTLPAGLSATAFTPTIKSYTIAALPTVTSANVGQQAFATDCRNGTQGAGSGTGCLYVVNTAGTWTPMPAPSNQSITVGGQVLLPGQATSNQGNGVNIATASGSFTTGDCVTINASGALVDTGSPCGGGSGSGIVTTALANQLAYYSSNGTSVAGLTVLANAVLVTSSGGVPSESTTLPSGLTIPSPVLSGVNTSALTAGVLGTARGGTGLSTFSLSGNTTQVVTTTGTLTSGNCVSIDANGNFIAAGGACTVGGGGGTVTSSTINSMPWYAGTGTVVTGLPVVNNAVLVTSASGVPTESVTLPSGLTIPSPVLSNINTSVLTAGVLPPARGGTGLTAFSTSGSTTKFVTSTGTLTTGHCVSIDSSGNYIDAGGACTIGGGGGTVSSATINAVPFYTATGTTIGGMTVVNNAVLVTSNTGVPSESTTLPSGLTIPSPILSGVSATSITTGTLAAANGGTGLSGFTVSGNTTKFTSTTGTLTNGHCVSIDPSGNLIDAGAACAGSSSGTVTAGVQNSLPFYSALGTNTIISPLTVTPSAVLVSNSTGVPALSTTLPTGLSATSMSLVSPAISGTGTYVALTGSGKLTTAASSVVAAGLNVPAGVAPTTPVNGDIWSTATALQARINGATVALGTGNGTLTSIATTAPISGGPITTTGTISCPLCATTNGGGALSALAPVVLTGNVISLSNQTGTAVFTWDAASVVSNGTEYIANPWPWSTGSLTSISYLTAGITPSFSIALQINGVNVATCSNITVTSATVGTTNCGANTITAGNVVALVITGASGTPSGAMISTIYNRSAN